MYNDYNELCLLLYIGVHTFFLLASVCSLRCPTWGVPNTRFFGAVSPPTGTGPPGHPALGFCRSNGRSVASQKQLGRDVQSLDFVNSIILSHFLPCDCEPVYCAVSLFSFPNCRIALKTCRSIWLVPVLVAVPNLDDTQVLFVYSN